MGRNSKPRSQRQLKVGEEIRHVLAMALMRGDFHVVARESFSVTISEVQVSPDLKHATVFVMPLAGKDSNKVLAFVKSLASQLRSHVAKALALRVIPMLHFELDTTYEEAHKINNLLNTPHVKQDLKKTDDAE